LLEFLFGVNTCSLDQYRLCSERDFPSKSSPIIRSKSSAVYFTYLFGIFPFSIAELQKKVNNKRMNDMLQNTAAKCIRCLYPFRFEKHSFFQCFQTTFKLEKLSMFKTEAFGLHCPPSTPVALKERSVCRQQDFLNL
jgi:hypothetical protein